MSKKETLNETRKPKLRLTGIRHSLSNYAIFEIQDKGIIRMALTGDKDKEHSFLMRDEAIEWLVNYADDFKRYFIVEQIIVY